MFILIHYTFWLIENWNICYTPMTNLPRIRIKFSKAKVNKIYIFVSNSKDWSESAH